MNHQSMSGIRFAGGFNVHDELHCAKALAAASKTKHIAVISIFIFKFPPCISGVKEKKITADEQKNLSTKSGFNCAKSGEISRSCCRRLKHDPVTYIVLVGISRARFEERKRQDTRINRNLFHCLNPLVFRHPIKLYARDGPLIVTDAKFGGNDSGGDWMIAGYH